jgi:hypothetical protein
MACGDVRVVTRSDGVVYGVALLEALGVGVYVLTAVLNIVNYGTVRYYVLAGAYLALWAIGIGVLLVAGRNEWPRRSLQCLWLTSGLMLVPLAAILLFELMARAAF